MEFQDIADFDLERQKLARRRKIAQEMMATRMPLATMSPSGHAMLPGAGGTLAAGFDRLYGNYDNNKIDEAELQNRMAERDASNAVLSNIPGSGPERTQAQIKAATNIPGLREGIKMQMTADEAESARQFRSQEAKDTRLFRQQEAEAKLIDAGEQRAADRVAREDLRRIPSQSIHVSVGGGARAGDGKPLTAAQEKAALELGSNRSNLQMLTDTFKDDYAGDIRSTVQRKLGEAAGGLAPQSTQDMTRWWANQAMFDELPQRHEMFGATLTAGEKASWNSAAINPNMSPKMIRERLAIRSKIYDDAEGRMRGSAVAGGRSGKQFDAATGNAPQQSAARVSVGSKAEFDALPAGTKWETPDGKRGTK